VRAVVGVINRDAEGLPLGDRRARRALNLAVNRDALVREAMFGRARPLAGLTPPTAITLPHRFPDRLSSYPHDADRAAELWREGAGSGGRPIRVAALGGSGPAAERVAADLREALSVGAEVIVCRDEHERRIRRRLAEKALPREWDVLVLEHGVQAADAPPHELHRAFVGATGEFRAGPVVPEFESLYAKLERHTSQVGLVRASNRIDRFLYEEAFALFLCAPQALYAVNEHVDFTAYRTTFELPECRVGEEHWSRR
jgi:ABC-type transport system substrate-binding protein